MPSESFDCNDTEMPPRSTPAWVVLASGAAATGSDSVPSTCASVACCTVTGTAAVTRCAIFRTSLACGPPCSAAATFHVSAPDGASARPSGVVTVHAISRAESAARSTVCAANVRPGTFGVTTTFIARAVVLRTVNWARNTSPSRTSGGKPEISCRSCVLRIDVLPVPKVPGPTAAMATIRKLVSASLSGTSSEASPLASSVTRGFQSSSVSNSSRVELCPPPPPAGTALRPK